MTIPPRTDMAKQHTIVIFGSSDPKPGEPAYEEARRLGAAIAEAGWILCNGGYGGTMAAGCRGAVEAGGQTIGVSCSAFGRSGVNRWVQHEVKTDDLNDRLAHLIELGDAYVALPGSTGTLLELAMVWELANKRFLPDKPIVLLGTYWRPVLDVVAGETPKSVKHIDVVETVDQVVAILLDRLKA